MEKIRLMFDYNSLAMRCLHLPQVDIKSDKPNYDFMAYLIFDQMYTEALKHTYEYGNVEVVIGTDAHDGYWRKQIYPPYKADRKRSPDVDWETAFGELNKLKENIQNYLPWKVISVPHCEADDILAVLARASTVPVVIYSGDSDYLQLVSDNIRVFNPHYGDYIEFPGYYKVSNGTTYINSPEEYLELCILTGQGGKDNVYNVKTPTDFSGKRKPPLGLKTAVKILDNGELNKYASIDTYYRNKKLIDLHEIPQEYQHSIIQAYKNYKLSEVDVVSFLSSYSWDSYNQVADELEQNMRNIFCFYT